MPLLDREYVRTGKVRLVFLHLALTQIHPNAVAAAEVAMCAGRQGKFWETHDALFLRQPCRRPWPSPLTLSALEWYLCGRMVPVKRPAGVIMRDDMGTFRVDVEVENPVRPGERRVLRSVLVDTGAELSWFPADVLESLGIERWKLSQFRQADGTVLARWTGAAFVHLAGTSTVDEVVFGAPGDLVILGSRSLEGLNLRIDPVRKQLVDAGPAPAACGDVAP
jgi:predicted aspartyl protease